jgi:predicted Zn-dependent peptidase
MQNGSKNGRHNQEVDNKMKKYYRVAAAAIIVLFMQFGLSAPARAVEYGITEHTLPNGLKVLVLEKHSTPVVAVQVWYRVGSHNEWPGVRGIAHLFEHMMFRGSEHYGPEEHSRLVIETGGAPNAFTSEDETVFHERLPASELELALMLEAERMHLLVLNQEVLNTERNVVEEEYRVNLENSPIGQIYANVQKLLYPDHPYSYGPLGVMADLERITVQDCRNFYDKFYAPNNAVLVVAGDVKTDSVLALTQRYFGSIPKKEIPPEPDLTLPPQTETHRFKEKVGLPIPVTVLAFRIPEARDPDIIPLRILSAILSSGNSSRLVSSLVRKKGIAVQAFGYPLIMEGPGYFAYGAAHFPNIAQKKVEKAVLAEIEKVKSDTVADQELEKAKKQLLADKTFQMYSAWELARSIGAAEVELGDYRLFQREIEEFGKVTKADIVRVANKYFTESNMTVLYLQPKKKNLLIWIYGIFKSRSRGG